MPEPMRLEEEAPAASTPPGGTPLSCTLVKATPAKAAEVRPPARQGDDDAACGSAGAKTPASLPHEVHAAMELLAAQLGAAGQGEALQPGSGSWEQVRRHSSCRSLLAPTCT